MTTALVKKDDAALATTKISAPADQGGIAIRTMADLKSFAEAAVHSGFFKDGKGLAQAVIKVQYGLEIGLSPVVAMNGIHCVDGKMAVSAGVIASQMTRAGYVVRVVRLDETGCELDVTRGGKSVGKSSFTVEDAKRAELFGKAMWKKYPRNMLYSRAVSNAQKWFAPEVFGCSVYTPEELASSDVPIDVVMQPEAVVEEPTEQVTALKKELAALCAARGLVKDDMARAVAHAAGVEKLSSSTEKLLHELRTAKDVLTDDVISGEVEE